MSDAIAKAASTDDGAVAEAMTMALEVVVIPVSDVDRALRFYVDLGWRLDLDFDSGDGYRVIQVTPPGSGCSVIFGSGITMQTPGSFRGAHLVVSDIAAARAELVRRGIEVSEPFHDPSGIFHRAGSEGRVAGPNALRKSYASFFSFSDPDGNSWTVQEVTVRLSADVTGDEDCFTPELLYAARHPPTLPVQSICEKVGRASREAPDCAVRPGTIPGGQAVEPRL